MPKDTTAATAASAQVRRAKKHQRMIEELRDAGALETAAGTAVNEYDRARHRVAEMHLSDQECTAMIHYLVGYNPHGVNLALDLVAIRRADAIKRAAALLEA